jgi:hypothetical protein
MARAKCLRRVREAKGILFRVLPEVYYYEYAGCCDARSIAFLAVKSCSKAFFAPSAGHRKSPCFSRICFLKVVSVDNAVLVFDDADGTNLLECAF